MGTKTKALAGKVAVITGASKGLGKAMAAALGAAGARLVLASRGAGLLGGVAKELGKAGAEATAVQMDVTSETGVAKLAEFVSEKLGGVDIVINNAGVNVRKPATEFTLEEWRRVIDTNLTGAFLVCRALLPLIKGRGGGRI